MNKSVYLVETYSKGKKPYHDGTWFEYEGTYIYYLDNKTKRVSCEEGTVFKDQLYTWERKTKHRSIIEMIRSHHKDFESSKNMFSVRVMNVTKLGEF